MILLDTHILVWTLLAPEQLSARARAALDGASARYLSAASLYEITLKGRLGKWPEVEHLLERNLTAELDALGFGVLPSSGEVMQLAGGLDWDHRDPFDRIILASSVLHGLDLVSKDRTLDSAPDPRPTRIW